jgi:NADH-quinone oxidoreductase subunit J
MEKLLFGIYAAGVCGSALAVVFSQNVVRMAFWLVIALGSTAGLFFMLGADFVGATQLLIYVGGTVVLLIFGVMLTASGPYISMKTSPGDVMIAAVVGGLFLATVAFSVMRVDWTGNAAKLTAKYGTAPSEKAGYNQLGEGKTTRDLGAALTGMRFDEDLGAPERKLSTGYLLPFEIVSIHLLVVLVGASYLARAKRRAAAPQP